MKPDGESLGRGEGWQVIVHLPGLFGERGSRFLEMTREEKLGECAGVVFPSLGSKSKEDEKDKRANDA